VDRQQIDRFFRILDAGFQKDAGIILTGAAAGAILGSERPSIDIDFAVDIKNPGASGWEEFDAAVRKAVAETGIQANYAEDIDRWGMITLLDYRNSTRLLKKYRHITLSVLKPEIWSIGKVTRFLDPDIKDMIQVFSRTKIVLTRFRRQAEGFFRSYGKKIWGGNFNVSKTIRQFHKSAGIKK
jgi:hypothetical protein